MSDPLFKKHEPCPECGSRDNVGVWANGSEHCFSPGCTYHMRMVMNIASRLDVPITLVEQEGICKQNGKRKPPYLLREH